MDYKLGIIPAAGKAERFGGVLKELLPTRDGTTFLQEAVNRCIDCDDVVIVTTPDKIADHARCIGSAAHYAIQHGNQDIWSAIRTGLDFPADHYLFTMPDTFVPSYVFSGWNYSAFGMGLFHTDTPERFGMFRDNNKVVNKQPGEPGMAWGVLAWSRKVAEYWMLHQVQNYTDAINMAISEFGAAVWRIDCYYDNASVQDYISYLRGVK